MGTVMETVIESCFKEKETDCCPSWQNVLDHISWPTGTRIQQILGQAVQSGHVLLLFAYLQFRRPQASSIKEEQMITSTVLEWLRNISLETGPGVEPKLPLLYRQLVTLLQRQNESVLTKDGLAQSFFSFVMFLLVLLTALQVGDRIFLVQLVLDPLMFFHTRASSWQDPYLFISGCWST